MPWGRVKIIASAVAGVALAVAPAAALANGIVVAISGPSASKYPVGTKVADNERIVLAPSDTVTVLDGRGTRVLKGAGTFTLSQQAGTSKTGAFALLTRERAAQRMRTGAVRGEPAGPITRPNLWYVDVSDSGPICVPKADEIRLWRPSGEGDATYSINPVGTGAVVRVVFRDGEVLSPWDGKALPVKDGASFVISQAKAAQRTITFKVLDAVPGEPDALAADLISHGCTSQLDVLSQAMKVDDE
jgi:hypothetical protein